MAIREASMFRSYNRHYDECQEYRERSYRICVQGEKTRKQARNNELRHPRGQYVKDGSNASSTSHHPVDHVP